MKQMPVRLFLFTCCLYAAVAMTNAQEPAIGEWRSHLPYKNGIGVAEAGNLIYCATPYSLFYFDRDDNSISRLNKVNGLSDIGISSINYSAQYKTLVVAYTNANIDLITEYGIRNISDIKRKAIYGNKIINRITFLGPYAYLSCGFGIVVLDLSRREIYDTYYIGPLGSSLHVNDFAYNDTCFYAATVSGIYSARRDHPNLANYAAWQKDSTLSVPNGSYKNITVFSGNIVSSISIPGFSGDTLYVNDGSGWDYLLPGQIDDYFEVRESQGLLLVCGYNGVFVFEPGMSLQTIIWSYNPQTPLPRSAIKGSDGFFWIADHHYGLVRNLEWENLFIKPNGPGSAAVYSLAIAGSDVWAAPGSLNSALGNIYNIDGPSSFIGENWYALREYNPGLDTLWDILYAAIDPSNHKRVFLSAWGGGLVETNNGLLTHVYSYDNSALERPYSFYNWVGIAGISFDKDGNLWALNAECNHLLKVLKPNGSWESFNVSSVVTQPKVTKLLIDSRGYKWVSLGGNGLLVYNDNNTLENKADDKIAKLTTNIGSGNLPGSYVLSMAEDMDGEIWIGTEKGIGVIYAPANIFSGGNYDAQTIIIDQDGTAQHLLEFESVTDIAIDGANKKWVGTQNAGVFLFSEDGQRQIYHFTAENSPLLSNTITSIAINGTTGEVFFGTDKGICSYRGYATTGKEQFQNVYAYPNPVPAGYAGMIGIKGLTKNSWIKITDVNGALIYETRSEGGQAVWNGRNFSGVRAQTGVYFVFCINEDGSQKMVTKILIHN